MSLLRKLLAEFVGTFFLLFVGVGAIIINGLTNNALTHLGVAFAFGIIILIGIYMLNNISGAHFNPAVSIALVVAKKFNIKELVPYFIAQLIGATSACYLLKILFADKIIQGLTLPTNCSVATAGILEMIFSLLLMLIIMGVSDKKFNSGNIDGLAIGFAIFVGALITGPLTGGSFNPVRSLGPAIVTGNFSNIVLYLLAPVAGTVLGVLIYDVMSPNLKTVSVQNVKQVQNAS